MPLYTLTFIPPHPLKKNRWEFPVVLSHAVISFVPMAHKGLIDEKSRARLHRGRELGIQEILNWFNKNEHHTFLKLHTDRVTKIGSVMRIGKKKKN